MSATGIQGISAETVAAVRGALFSGPPNAADLRKDATTQGIDTTTGLVGYNLEAPSKKLFPVLSPLRNRFARVRGFGNAVHWKAITAINADGLDMAVAEGERNTVSKTTEVDHSVAYKSINNEGFTTFEALAASRNFEDVRAMDVANTLSGLMVGEEVIILGGNIASLAKPSATGFAASNSDNAGPFTAATAYDFGVSALTLAGWRRKATGHTSTDATGETDVRTLTTFSTGSGKTSVTLKWAAVRGAVAYNVFIGTHLGTLYFAFTTTQTSITVDATVIAALPGSGNVPNTADTTANALQFDGVIAQLAASGSGAYFQDLQGAALLGNNAGGITQWDDALQSLWDTAYIGPTVALVSSQEAKNALSKIAANGATTTLRLNATVGANGEVAGGLYLGSYLNKFTQQPFDILTHPFLPPGTTAFLSERLPYPQNNVPNPFEIDARREYTQIDYGLVSRKYEYGVWASEVLKVYFPAGCALLVGGSNG